MGENGGGCFYTMESSRKVSVRDLPIRCCFLKIQDDFFKVWLFLFPDVIPEGWRPAGFGNLVVA